MNRRTYLKTMTLASAGIGTMPVPNAINPNYLDKYGGWTGRKFKATGFFRVKKDDIRRCVDQIYTIAIKGI